MLVEFRDHGFVRSVIVITHDLAILYQIADTILVMYAGKLAGEGAGGDDGCASPPAPRYTRLLLSSLPEVGVTYAEKKLNGIRGGRRRSSTHRAAAGSVPAARWRPRSASRSRPSSRSTRTTTSRAGRREREMLTLEKVTKVYRTGTFGSGRAHGRRRRLFFDVRPGEVVSLIGESGSGKSTIGRLILRLAPASEGRVAFDGVDVSTLRHGALKGYYRQSAGRLPGPVQLVTTRSSRRTVSSR